MLVKSEQYWSEQVEPVGALLDAMAGSVDRSNA